MDATATPTMDYEHDNQPPLRWVLDNGWHVLVYTNPLGYAGYVYDFANLQAGCTLLLDTSLPALYGQCLTLFGC